MRAVLPLLLLMIATAVVRAQFFTDVPDGTRLCRDVTDAAYHQLMEGYPDGAFRPAQPLTRAGAVMIYARLLSVALKGFMVMPGAAEALPVFDDVPATHWMRPAATFLAEHGLAPRGDGARFLTAAPVTRGDLAVALYRLQHAGMAAVPADAAGWLHERSLLPEAWLASLEAPVTRGEVARLLNDLLLYLTQHAMTEGTITRFDDGGKGQRWMYLDTAIGPCKLVLPDVGVEVTDEAALREGMAIRTISDAVNGGGQTYYRVRKATVLPTEIPTSRPLSSATPAAPPQ